MTPLRSAALAAALFACAGSAAADELRIGFLNTTTGQGALIGKFLESGWKLGLEHAGWTKDGDKLGGVPTRIFYGDDQSRPDVGIREVDKFIKSDKVHIVAGQLWSHVLMATQKPIFDAKVMLISTNAGPSPLAGELCNPLFVASGSQNDLVAEATGELVNRDGIKTVMGLAPNYQAGKDYLGGFERSYKGKMLDNVKLAEQAGSNAKAQFSNSPDLGNALTEAVMDAMETHANLSAQALNSEVIRAGLLEVLLGPGQLWEALRQRTGSQLTR